MENIQQWIKEVCYFYKDLFDDCSNLSKEIEKSIKSLLQISEQESRIEFISDTLNLISQENQIYSQTKSKLKTSFERIKETQNFPDNIIDSIFKDENIIPPNDITITEQVIKDVKEKIIQTCSILKNDIDSINEIFYDDIYKIANQLYNIQEKKKSNRAISLKKSPIFNYVLEHFYPHISVYNLYVAINIQQNFKSKFKNEIDAIVEEEALENAPPPPQPTPLQQDNLLNDINDNVLQPLNSHSIQTHLPTILGDDLSFNIFQQNDINNFLRTQNRTSMFNMNDSPIGAQTLQHSFKPRNNISEPKAANDISQIENLKKIIQELQKENDGLKEQIKDYQETVELNDEVILELSDGNEKMQDEIDKLTEKNKKLQKLLEDNDIQINLS